MDNQENNPQNNSSDSQPSINNQTQAPLNYKDFVVNKDDTVSLVDGKTNINIENKTKLDNTINSNNDMSLDTNDKSSRMGTIITIILIVIIIGGIWQSSKDKQSKISNVNDDVNIVVDSNKETGTVTIVNGEEIKSQEVVSGAEKVGIMAYYNKEGGNECEDVVLLERMVEKKYDSPIINTVRGLLTPLSEAELKAGYLSSIPEGTYLRSVSIENGVAKVVFSAALNNVAGSCRVMAIRSQIEKTLMQFSYIKAVDICIDNNCNQDEILQP